VSGIFLIVHNHWLQVFNQLLKSPLGPGLGAAGLLVNKLSGVRYPAGPRRKLDTLNIPDKILTLTGKLASVQAEN
jgi:hypothetical protein